jgi:hypothetical protein
VVPVPLAVGLLGFLLIILGILVLVSLAYMLIARNNPRQVEVDDARERAVEQVGLHEPVDFGAEFKPPRDP